MGLGPLSAEKGDLICVLYGYDKPLVIRKKNGYHVVVGECYVYGLIYGEAMEGLSSGKLQEQRFVFR